eukprot:TRINITY_DN1668_c0_g1_i1.p1 TRINITY_DN1668_c0_g1~~TRINITY_DN1668_c0_g1_i1.p1  ORF type:complete len:406 (+),score=131.67 TRINITY_DN1668_c0_g1_i1:164-1219(+)
MGNEASDCDSIVSSVFFAFLLKMTTKHMHVPVINIPREDLVLRTETWWLLHETGIDISNLVFLPEVKATVDKSLASKQLEVTLVDHNILAGWQKHLEEAVVRIMDHHKEEKKCTRATGSDRVIEMVGSCASLVARAFKETNNLSLLSNVEKKILLAPILLDTANLDPKFQKVTPVDADIATILMKDLSMDAKQQKEYNDKLTAERFSVESLSTNDLLRMDYKAFKLNIHEVGISSVKKSIKDWLKSEPHLPKAMESFRVSQKLDILYAMTIFMDEKENVHRELVILSPSGELLENSMKFLLKTDLKLEQVEQAASAAFLKEGYHVAFLVQHNTGASRKQLQPLLSDFYEKK